MGFTRGQIKSNIALNLDDVGVTFNSDQDLDNSFQDAYDDILLLSQCLLKVADHVPWQNNIVYYNLFSDLGVTDYIAVVAIFNYNTNRWLRDDLTLRDFDRLQRNWEIWQGTPQFWTPSDPQHFAIAPNYGPSAVGTFKMLYWAQAPELSTDADTLLVASDCQDLFEFYCTADMLEVAQEYTKANDWWTKYYSRLEEYSERVKANNKSDLLLRV